MEIVINDGYSARGYNEDRIIKLVSDGGYDNDDVKNSVNNLIKFMYSHTSSGFIDELTQALNQHTSNNFRKYKK